MRITNGLINTVLFLIIFLLYMYIDYRKNRSFVRTSFIFLFYIYFINLVGYVVFPIYIKSSIADEIISRYDSLYNHFLYNLELIPFKGISFNEFLLNILLTFPLGCFIPVLKKGCTFKKMILFGLSIGILFELNQIFLMFIQGFTLRVISVNDVIANFLGVVLGYIFFMFSFKTVSMIFEKDKNTPKILNNYIDYIKSYNPKI